MGPGVTSDTVEGLGAPLTADIVAVSGKDKMHHLATVKELIGRGGDPTKTSLYAHRACSKAGCSSLQA